MLQAAGRLGPGLPRCQGNVLIASTWVLRRVAFPHREEVGPHLWVRCLPCFLPLQPPTGMSSLLASSLLLSQTVRSPREFFWIELP